MTELKHPGTEILRVLAGSRAYGLEDENSDWDYHGVFVAPTVEHLKMFAKPINNNWTEKDENGQESTFWEIRHFLEQSSKGNPTMLETFFAPIVEINEMGHDLKALSPYVLNRRGIYEGYRGYAKNQRAKIFDPDPEMVKVHGKVVRQRKAAIACLRSLVHGCQLLRDGWYDTHLSHSEARGVCLMMRNGSIEIPEMLGHVMVWEARLDAAYVNSRIQETPNYERLDRFLLRVRQELWR